MKIDENICIAPHCEEIKLLVKNGCPFCIEHLTKFDDFYSRWKVDSKIDNILEIDEDFQNEFFTDMVNYFFVEEEAEYHRKNKQVLKKKKLKKKKKNKKRK
ncbi:hypothetical protein [Spiroplasma phoeniceum]|uniref:Uncharacterized protein n=1 Tax=Spiroplasma phoeniceum P40 TaxID=1276259 RepID=A0A345DSN2_9MOLU|nr:hypothetical protein [Spiroplasma phoeniceum]AXF97223.1 hypothetical protein SDAV_003026 [Spiroplasma phoeniceum P40]